MIAADSIPNVDEESPWLGLVSYTEETRGYFFGREGEIVELTRRVQRKLLTVLFGKSGLGKTSILQAGLVPGLRDRGYFPVYLRVDYGQDSPEPAEQIKQGIERAAASGEWTQPGVAIAGESIWEFLHHRDDVLKDKSGATLIPLLIFDQFEELFTLAQSDEFGRARAARFIEELADLVENRPPKALEARLDSDDSIAERFDFARSDYRVVIALREDYLAPLESLKKVMPSLSQNRLRLAPMTGSQALEAVLQPGKNLVSQEVAEAIVRFVAGGAELANAEVEPSLLSLICRELNDQRIAQNRSEISLDLLAGSHEGILSSFYERALADQPAAVRRLIEDELLTESGYRENLAEESLQRKLQTAGAATDALATLVNRRLLRIEERLDVRRVELTHDVLTGVVKASRDQRHEREAREATERLLAEQAARETAARRALRRARAVAAGCTVLAAAAVVAAVLAVINVQRARHAEADARQTRAVSEQARVQAEGLLAFLTDDFVRELETFGRYQTIAELAQREIDYFNALPPQLKDPQSIRNGALALVNHARAAEMLGDSDSNARDTAAAVALLEPLRRKGDRSDATTVVLARAYMGPVSSVNPADLLRPIAAQPGASQEVRRAYVEALDEVGKRDFLDLRNEEAVRVAREAMRLATQLGAGRHVDLTLDYDYAWAEVDLVGGLNQLGRDDEARQAAKDVLGVLDPILAQRPQYGAALDEKGIAEEALTEVAGRQSDPVEALRFAMEDTQTSLALVRLEPKNMVYLNQLGNAYSTVGSVMWRAGRLREAIGYRKKAMEAFGQAAVIPSLMNVMANTARDQALLGDAAGITANVAAVAAFAGKLDSAARDFRGVRPSIYDALLAYPSAVLAYERRGPGAAQRIAREALVRLEAARPTGASPTDAFQTRMENAALCDLSEIAGRSGFALGDFAAAEQWGRAALQSCTADAGGGMAAQVATWLSMALAAQGKHDEASRTIGPVVAMYRALAKKNHGDQWLPLELAGALYAQSLTDDAHRAVLLREAAGLVEHLTPSIAVLHDTREWRARIEAAQRTASGEARR